MIATPLDALETVGPADGLCTVEELAGYLRRTREAVGEAVRARTHPLETMRAYSDRADALMSRILALACDNAGGGATPESVPIAVVATGGYGRRELCPHSDIDITFIPHRDGDALVDRVIKEMFTLVMQVFIDANNMQVGYAYRLLEDCAGLDHQTTCGLLDARLIAGSSRLFIQFEGEFHFGFNHAEFIFTKLVERRQQQREAGGSTRVVEPNLKLGPGGIRDLHAAIWLTQAREGLDAAQVRGERAWEVLAKHADVQPGEIAHLVAAKDFVFAVRNALHVLAGEERDQLVVTRQEEVARLLGYEEESLQVSGAEDILSERLGASNVPPVETFMRDYYRHAAACHRICDAVMRRAEDGRIFLGIGLDSVERRIEPAGQALLQEDPSWMLWVCELAQKHNLELSDALERAILAALARRPHITDGEQAADIFTRILACPNGAFPILEKMADLGILGWVLPEVGNTIDLIPYDPSHDHTVGQHTLYVVRNLDSLRAKSGPEDLRDFRMLMQELAHPEQLYLAALLHDAGKAIHGRPHSETGAELAENVCRRLGWSDAASANVVFLVRHHLLMDETARLRDLNMDVTIRRFTAVVDDIERLNMLYLLSYADTSAVGAGVWTHVKARFLRDLYHRVERVLAGEEAEEYDDAELTRIRRRILKELSEENLPQEEVAAHVAGMPAPYILNTSQADMTLHIGFARRARQGEIVVDFVSDRDSTYTEVTICTRDDPEPGLLSKIAGVLYAADLSVHSAQVFTRPSAPGEAHAEDIAIDTLYVDFRARQLTSGKRKEVATNLQAVLSGKVAVSDLLTKKKKPSHVGGPVEQVAVHNDLSDRFTVVEVASTDSQAALYRISGALSSLGWDILSAKVSQFRGRSIANFYVAGAKHLSDHDARATLSRIMPAQPVRE